MRPIHIELCQRCQVPASYCPCEHPDIRMPMLWWSRSMGLISVSTPEHEDEPVFWRSANGRVSLRHDGFPNELPADARAIAIKLPDNLVDLLQAFLIGAGPALNQGKARELAETLGALMQDWLSPLGEALDLIEKGEAE